MKKGILRKVMCINLAATLCITSVINYTDINVYAVEKENREETEIDIAEKNEEEKSEDETVKNIENESTEIEVKESENTEFETEETNQSEIKVEETEIKETKTDTLETVDLEDVEQKIEKEVNDKLDRLLKKYPDIYINDKGNFVISDENGVTREYDPYDPEFDRYFFEEECEESDIIDNGDAQNNRINASSTVSPFTHKTYIHEGHVSEYKISHGIDVSKYQKDIDWSKARAAGVEFAFIRIGYRGYGQSGKIVKDDYAIKNINNAYNAGVKVGIYFFSQAITVAEAAQEAAYCRDFLTNNGLKGKISMPVIIDYEFAGGDTGRLTAAKLSAQQHQTICDTFSNNIRSYGYTSGIYANYSMLMHNMIPSQSDKTTKYWIARYNTFTDYTKRYEYWQYSSKGEVPGISEPTDCNFWYTDIKEIKNLNDSYCHINITDVIEYTHNIADIVTVYDSSASYYLVRGKDYNLDVIQNSKTTAVITLTGIGNYKGTVTKNVNMTPMTLTKAMVSSISDQVYNGTPFTTQNGLDLSIYHENFKLVENTDYIVQYENNTNVGKAAVIITGKGFYSGTVKVYFNIGAKTIKNVLANEFPDQVYRGKTYKVGNGLELEVIDRELNKRLNEGIDYNITYENAKNVGKATVTINGIGNYKGSITRKFNILPVSIGDGTESLLNDITVTVGKLDTRQGKYNAYYTGNPVKPAITVTKGEKTLVLNTDYKLKYYDNKQVDEKAYVIITGKGNYSGSIKAYFSIIQKSIKITDDMVSLVNASMRYTGGVLKPEACVIYKGKKLIPDTDYTVTYQTSDKSNISEIKSLGKYYVVITGKGNYRGSVSKTFKVTDTEKYIIGKEYTEVKIQDSSTFIYNKKAYKPLFEIKNLTNGSILKENKDYTINFIGNKNAGEARFVIKGKGNYTGSYTGTFNILPANIGNISALEGTLSVSDNYTKININKNRFTYNGKKRIPTITISTILNNGKKATLTKGTDFDVITENMSVTGDTTGINAGKYRLIIKFKGNYVGEAMLYYDIEKTDLSKLTVSVPKQAYTGAQICPGIDSMNIMLGSVALDSEDLFGVKLTDWDGNSGIISKASFVMVADSSSINFISGSLKKVKFDISKKSIKADSIAYAMGGKIVEGDTADIRFEYTGQAYNSKNGAMVAVADVNNVNPILKEGVDYTVKYSSNKNAGKAKATITGIGCYKSSKTIYFTIDKKPIANNGELLTSFNLNTTDRAYTFTGGAITPPAKLCYNGKELVNGTDYTVKYSKNIDAGKAKITVSGIGNYSGSVIREFTITPKNVSSITNKKISSIPDQAYTGNVVVPALTVKVDGRILTKGKDYTVSVVNSTRLTFIDNGHAKGIATVIVNGAGNYSGLIGKKDFIVVK